MKRVTNEHRGKLLFVVNCPVFFLSHRLPLALAASQSGYEVHVATAVGEATKRIADHGLIHHILPLSRSGKNPVAELKAFLALHHLMTCLKPELVHLITIKPVIYGGLSARLTGIPGVVAAVSGLGTVFITQGGEAKLIKRVVSLLYRIALGHRNLTVIFQNPDDKDILIGIGAVDQKQACIIRGSGVALQDCLYVPEPEGKVVVTMASRLLRDKGVEEFVEAAKLLVQRKVDAGFRLIGSPDPGNPTSITENKLQKWREEGVVELMGYREDIPYQYAQSHIVCLPSYREGLPKSLAEAAACGRAVVTTDVPGCRDAIDPGESGLLVPPKNTIALADAIQCLIENPEKRRGMGKAGRDFAERELVIEKIIDAHLKIYRDLEAKV